MGELLFSPNGRIGPEAFMRGAWVLIIAAFVIALLPIISPILAIVSIVQLVFIWCWIALWVKRYHDSGQSGWMCLVPIVTYVVLSWLVSAVMMIFLVSSSGIIEALENADETSNSEDVFGTLMTGGQGAPFIFGSALAAAALSFAVAFVFNKIIRSDPAPNMYGPPTGDALAATFD